MDNFISFCDKILRMLHSVTGFFVHPEKGGCCKDDKDSEKS